jgi:hypothetical protein
MRSTMISKISAAALLAVIAFASPPAQASGAAPWCAVINLGTGDVYWDCQYASFEGCYPHVLSGNRGFCNHNPAYVGSAPVSRKMARRHRARQY